MVSVAFPSMFSTASTNLVEDKEATLSNLKLLIDTNRLSFFGDPGYGNDLKTFIFEQNNTVLRDVVIDELYTSILTYFPQLYVQRKNIQIKQNQTSIYAQINCINKIDGQPNMFEIELMNETMN